MPAGQLGGGRGARCGGVVTMATRTLRTRAGRAERHAARHAGKRALPWRRSGPGACRERQVPASLALAPVHAGSCSSSPHVEVVVGGAWLRSRSSAQVACV